MTSTAAVPDQQPAPNSGVTSYNPDAVESCQFASSATGDLLVGVSGQELVGFAVESNAPSTSFFFELLDQVARCVAVCAMQQATPGGGSSAAKEWLVAVGGDGKFVDVFRVRLDGHVARCHTSGRIGPFPKRVQGITVLHEQLQMVLVADRFGDVYQCFLERDAQPPLGRQPSRSVQRSADSSPTADQAGPEASAAAAGAGAAGGGAASAGGGGGGASGHGVSFNRDEEHPHLRFQLQHLGLISAMLVVPSTFDGVYSPLLLSCDSDAQVRVSCGRRPGLVLANLWREYDPELRERSQQRNINYNFNTTNTGHRAPGNSAAANAQQSTNDAGDAAANDDDEDGSACGPAALCVGFLPQQQQQQQQQQPHLVVAGRCDGTISAWTLQRAAKERLDVPATATYWLPAAAAGSASRSNAPVVGVVPLSMSFCIFATADKASLFCWDLDAKTAFELPRDGASAAAAAAATASSPPVCGLFACPHISPTACLLVYRDCTVELVEIERGGAQQRPQQCRARPFPASANHPHLPLPFSQVSKDLVARCDADAHVAIVTKAIKSVVKPREGFTAGGGQKGAAGGGNNDDDDDDDDDNNARRDANEE